MKKGKADKLPKPQDDSHEFVIRLTADDTKLHAIVAVHSSVRGPAHGGTRMKVYSTEEEALEDVLNLSRAMSYKSALADLPYGGAKAVIILKAGEEYDRKKLLESYANRLNQLGGLFRTGTDVGLTDKDTAFMSRFCRYILGLPKAGSEEWSTSNTAARGVFIAMRAAVKHKYRVNNLAGLKIGVKGVGKLGGHLVDLLVDDGANVTIADIDKKAVAELTQKHPKLIVDDPAAIHKLKMHVYAPCAFGSEFSNETVDEVNCEIIVGGANNQLCSADIGDKLHDRGVMYIPDYVCNAGGLIFVCEDLEEDGFKPKRILQRLDNIALTVRDILEQAEKSDLPPHRVADMIARMRIKGSKK